MFSTILNFTNLLVWTVCLAFHMFGGRHKHRDLQEVHIIDIFNWSMHFYLHFYFSPLDALHLKFSKATGLWTAKETCVYIGEPMGMEGKQRRAIWVTFLHQEERLSRYGAH